MVMTIIAAMLLTKLQRPSEQEENKHDKLLSVLQAPCFHNIDQV
jgi:hypothetical protein